MPIKMPCSLHCLSAFKVRSEIVLSLLSKVSSKSKSRSLFWLFLSILFTRKSYMSWSVLTQLSIGIPWIQTSVSDISLNDNRIRNACKSNQGIRCNQFKTLRWRHEEFQSAFYGCSQLQSIVIPDSVTSIGDYAFATCVELASIELPLTLTALGEGAFFHLVVEH